ncbi:MAG: DNA polymerase/3'-5' exonuclease PolX [Candidatus Portnoybacteria bacterium]|nr:DNA polymerase/3'-5' exonuclease PolX [Candidatus Portnoybacteria bacterium]
MINIKISKIFFQMAEYYVMKDVAFKPQAYERAARVIESMDEDLEGIYKESGIKGLVEIEGIGQGMAEKIEEFIKTGKVREYEKLKKECPVDLEALTAVEGLGPKKIKVLYENLGIRSIKDLERAAKIGKIRELPHFGPKIEENILKGIGFAQAGQGRFLLGSVLPMARRIEKKIAGLEFVSRAVAAGSVRRFKETIGDIDILTISDQPEKVMDFFCSMPEVEKVTAKGETKSAVRLDSGINADIRVVPEESFGAALQYFTGGKDHNIELRKIAQEKKMKLNEYGIFRGKKQVAGKTEEEVYEALNLRWMEPELRENAGEIEASREKKLPKLVDLKNILGDLQMHSDWSDGEHTIKEMAEEAAEMGYKYIALTDHTGDLQIAGGLDEKTILKYFAEIEKIDKELKGFRILKGLEVNIRKNGTLDISDEVLAKADIVLASVHSNFKMPREEQTERICRAMQNPCLDIIAHPTGRIIGGRPGYDLDMEKIFDCAKKTGTILEINSYPNRLDLRDAHIRRAVEKGLKLSLGTDSHARNQLRHMELGVAQARRGWCEKKDIINTMDYDELAAFLKSHKK